MRARLLRLQDCCRHRACFRSRMAGQVAAIAIDPSSARGCRTDHRPDSRRLSALGVTDRFAPKRSARGSGERQHPLPDAETDGVEVSWHSPIKKAEMWTSRVRMHSREVLVAEPTSSGKYLGCHGIAGTEQDLVARVPGSASNGRWCVR